MARRSIAPHRSQRRPLSIVLTILLASGMLCGCKSGDPFNASFPVTLDEAKGFLETMEGDPLELDRPLVIAGGIYDPGWGTSVISRKMKKIANGEHPVITVTFLGKWSFDECRTKLIAAVEEEIPSRRDGATVEVDVVGISMGGLVARYAAMPGSSKRLRISRLFTIATPHRGARMADLPTLDGRAKDMRAGSAFLERLDEARREYPIYAYTRLGDLIVGSANTAPPGQNPWWVTRPAFGLGHQGASGDARILADIARRLRGESPLTLAPPEPLPGRTEEAIAALEAAAALD